MIKYKNKTNIISTNIWLNITNTDTIWNTKKQNIKKAYKIIEVKKCLNKNTIDVKNAKNEFLVL